MEGLKELSKPVGSKTAIAQVAAISDDIAYDNHDIDDGLRAGILKLDQLLEVPVVNRCWRSVRMRHPDVPAERLMRELVREQIGLISRLAYADLLREPAP